MNHLPARPIADAAAAHHAANAEGTHERAAAEPNAAGSETAPSALVVVVAAGARRPLQEQLVLGGRGGRGQYLVQLLVGRVVQEKF